MLNGHCGDNYETNNWQDTGFGGKRRLGYIFSISYVRWKNWLLKSTVGRILGGWTRMNCRSSGWSFEDKRSFGSGTIRCFRISRALPKLFCVNLPGGDVSETVTAELSPSPLEGEGRDGEERQ